MEIYINKALPQRGYGRFYPTSEFVKNMMKKKLHTIKWDEICKPICEGGLGIRESNKDNLTIWLKPVGDI